MTETQHEVPLGRISTPMSALGNVDVYAGSAGDSDLSFVDGSGHAYQAVPQSSTFAALGLRPLR